MRRRGSSKERSGPATRKRFRDGRTERRNRSGTLALTVSDRQGRRIHTDGEEIGRRKAASRRKTMPVGEQWAGRQDRAVQSARGELRPLEHRRLGFDRGTDPIYKSIPFTIASGGAGGAYGLFLDNSWRSSFDFGHRDENQLAISADDGPIDYYLIAGPTVADVVRRYTDLTGKAPLPPRWALGFQQSRYSYMTDAELREVAARLRSIVSRQTSFGSTSTIRTATGRSRSTRRPSRTCAASRPTCAGRASSL